MSTHLGDLLDTARRQRFVGRHRELASFDDALAGRSPRRVLFVHGHGGIGKTTLLQEFRARARAAGRTVVQIDGRDVDPSPEGLRHGRPARRRPTTTTASRSSGCRPARSCSSTATSSSPRSTGGCASELIPGLRADTVVVLAGRDPPTAPWRTDPGWRQLVAVHRLDPSTPAKAANCSPTPAWHRPMRPHLVALGRGHPLTMALLADLAASGQVPDTLADAPDLISTLLESFLRDVPSDAHLTGLATCAIAWLTTEDLLAQLVGADAPAVWQWLARRPFITIGPRGLFTHDLARDVLDAEFQRRAPERYRTYRRIIYDHAVAGLRAATGLDRQLHAQQLIYLMRNSPFADAISALRAQGSATVVPARPDDHDQVCAIIERFEGPTSADLARAWLAERPEHLSVVRTGDGVAGFAYHVLCPSGSALEDRDPVVRAVLDHVARHGPTRPGERVDIVRFTGGARDHQRDLYALLAGPVSSVIEWLTRPLAWSFVVVVDVEYWAPYFDYIAFAPLVDVDVDGLRHVAYGIDWRRFPVDAWFDLMHERGRSGGNRTTAGRAAPPATTGPRPLRRRGQGRTAEPAPARPTRHQPLARLRPGRHDRRAERRPAPGHHRRRRRPPRQPTQRRPAPGRPAPHLPAPRPHPGSRRRGPRPTPEHLPPLPGQSPRTTHRPALDRRDRRCTSTARPK